LAFVLLAILLALIVSVLALPRIPAVRRMAGVEEELREPVPMPVVTENYRPWMLRPVARTGDGFSISSRRGLEPIEPVTVLQGRSTERLPYPPQGIRVYGSRGPRLSVSPSASEGQSCRLHPGMQPECKDALKLAITLGNRQLLDSCWEPDNGEQPAGTARFKD
jgi:hypothetical protein